VRAPLEARLYPSDRGALRFALGESSYVAVFELAPGRGARLVYPADDAAPERALAPGWHTAPAPERDALAAEPAARLDVPGDTRYLYMIAARRPLGLAPGRRTPDAIARSVGLLAFRSADPGALAGALAQRAVALPGAGDWVDTPLIAVTPGESDPLARAADATVRCPDGLVYRVPADASRPFECPR
jgi:hypothetical protein